jgi:hypothetical protein
MGNYVMSTEAIPESQFLREFTKELHNKNAAIFAGAGFSMPAGFVDWKDLLRRIIQDLSLDPDKEHDLVTIAQYSINKAGDSKTHLTQTIIEHFSSTREPTENHTILARLPIHTYWTTNYDRLIEKALEKAKKVPDVKYTVKQLSTTHSGRDAVVYKMHGDAEHGSEAVISKDDYERYPLHMAPFVTALRGDLVEKTFLFLGFSFTDPNIDYILSRVRGQFERNSRHHYCIQRCVSQENGESVENFKYRQLKQDYFIRDLKRFSIFTVLVDNYSDITRLLKQIESNFKRSSIFISGSAEVFGSSSSANAQLFIHELSRNISAFKNRIITGFGLGVGSAVINGVLSHLDSLGKTISDEDIVIRPFPQVATGSISLSEQWTAYRKAMLSHAGIAVFLFGNKKDGSGKILSANGMREEFELALKAGVKVLPIGATGYMAESLWQEVNEKFDTYFPKAPKNFSTHFAIIGNSASNHKQITESILELIKLIQED